MSRKNVVDKAKQSADGGTQGEFECYGKEFRKVDASPSGDKKTVLSWMKKHFKGLSEKPRPEENPVHILFFRGDVVAFDTDSDGEVYLVSSSNGKEKKAAPSKRGEQKSHVKKSASKKARKPAKVLYTCYSGKDGIIPDAPEGTKKEVKGWLKKTHGSIKSDGMATLMLIMSGHGDAEAWELANGKGVVIAKVGEFSTKEMKNSAKSKSTKKTKRIITGMSIWSQTGVEVGHCNYKPRSKINHDMEPSDFAAYDSDGIGIPEDATLVITYDNGDEESIQLNDIAVMKESTGKTFDDNAETGPCLFVRIDWHKQTWPLLLDGDKDISGIGLTALSAANIKVFTEDVPEVGGGTIPIVKSLLVAREGQDEDIELEIGEPNGCGEGSRVFEVFYKGEWFDVTDEDSWKKP